MSDPIPRLRGPLEQLVEPRRGQPELDSDRYLLCARVPRMGRFEVENHRRTVHALSVA